MLRLNDAIQYLPRIGPERAKHLEKLGIHTVGELLYYFPRSYEDRRRTVSISEAAMEEAAVCVRGMVASRPVTSLIRSGLKVTKVTVVDDAGYMTVTFFNQTYVSSALLPGKEYLFFGKAETDGRRVGMTNPVFEPAERQRFTGRIMPVYPLTAGITNNLLALSVQSVLRDCLGQVTEPLPEALRREHDLMPIAGALREVHFPENEEKLERARRRLVFEELFYFSLGLTGMKVRRSARKGIVCAARLEEYLALLPFALTGAQRRALGEAAADMTSGRTMNRLLQGDVGSGKTVVAAGCLFLAGKSGWQSALMAPTELLARQHFETLEPLLAKSGLRVRLLVGSLRAKEKRELYREIAEGGADVVIGTHALLSEGVRFRRLGLVVTDEQHRFGVAQRAALADKGADTETHPHVLVLSATPIPRTLALILYGELEVSIIDERPPGRQEVDTFLIGEDKRQRMYGFIRRQKNEGHQSYLVCPAIGEEGAATLQSAGLTPAQELKAVQVYAEKLRTEVFPDLRVGLIHGRLSAKAKSEAMKDFSDGKTDVLVATTIVEVGMDVPNATLMVIENAERFGLSQLHQLRGRVGRGSAKSYCVLVSANRSPETRKRLRALCATGDGFKIAEADLELRGPGDFFGQRQHGLPRLRVADLAGDITVLQEAQRAAEALLREDPELTKPENRGIQARVQALFAETEDRMN